MSENVQITLIITFAILITLFVYRGQLSRFFFKANKDGIEADIETHKSETLDHTRYRSKNMQQGVQISDNVQRGTGNQIDVGRNSTTISNNEQKGKDNKIRATDNKPTE